MQQMDFSLLKHTVEINSWTKNKAGVDKVGEIMAMAFSALGFTEKRFERDTIGDHRFFQSMRCENAPKWLFIGHLDTVFPPDRFEGFREDDDWVYGPGVCDMKGGNFVAFKALERLYQAQGKICNVDILLVSDEETGSDDSASVTTHIAKDYDLCLDFEAAGENHEVVVARKGVATFQVDLKGKAAHAGNCYSDGINANLAAAKLLVALTALTDLEQGTTVNVGTIAGGIGANTISPEAKLSVEMRFMQNSEKSRVINSFVSYCQQAWVKGIEIVYSGGVQREVMMPSSAQTAWLNQFEKILGYPLKTEHRGGVSDANTVSSIGVPTLDGFGPYGDGDHTVKERALKTSFERRIEEVFLLLQDHHQRMNLGS